MKLTKALFSAASEHALAEFPNESCGYIVDAKGLRYVPCTNLATESGQKFKIGGKDYMAASKRGKIVGVVHSHPQGSAQPSEGDLAACEASKLPWHILAVHRGDSGALAVVAQHSWRPTGHKAPLVGRSFFYGVLDCWSLARDWYREELGIEMCDFDHGEDGWWANTDPYFEYSPYEDAAYREAAGLVKLPKGTELQKGDILVMQIRSKSGKPNHVGVLVEPNGSIMLHHLYGALSDRTVYGGYWQEATRFILRHKSRV